MQDRHAKGMLERLAHWVEQFQPCFTRRSQRLGLAQYLDGLLGDSRRKSMRAMLARVTEPIHYQSFQHFLTHSPWDARIVWRRLLDCLPEHQGYLILDDTGFPKQGKHSVGVARQYCPPLGKIANCQIAVTAALWTKARAWLLAAELYLPEAWLDATHRARAGIPARVRFQEKWRMGLALVRRAVGAGLQLEAVLADAAYGDVTAFRNTLDRMKLLYGVGISSNLTVFQGSPRTVSPPAQPRGGRPRTRPVLASNVRSRRVSELARKLSPAAWRRVSWRNGTARAWKAEFVALRVTPAHDVRRGRMPPEVWLVCQRPCGARLATKYYFSNLPSTATLHQLVRLLHHRWAIEKQYQDLKSELGADDFEGRSYPGWNHHLVLCAIAYAFLQKERIRRRRSPPLTFPQARALVQATFTGLLLATRPQYLDKLIELRKLYLALRM